MGNGAAVLAKQVRPRTVSGKHHAEKGKQNSSKNKSGGKKRFHPKYGTSKLEKRFAEEFLIPLGIKFEYQFEAKEIGRFYDFYLPEHNLIIEVDGDYYHAYNVPVEEMNPMQKHNKRVDEQKNYWAACRGIVVLRVWEHDINDNPSFVKKRLEEVLGVQKKKRLISESRKRPHKKVDL